MEEYLIIDGYNMISAWPNLKEIKESNLEYAREKLINIISEFAASTGQKTIIVFDAYMVKHGMEKTEIIDGIQVIYTKEGVTADMAIERLAAQIPKHRKVFVATSDRLQQETIWGKGAFRISAMELYREIQLSKKEGKAHYNKKTYTANRLEDRIHPDIREKLEKMQKNELD